MGQMKHSDLQTFDKNHKSPAVPSHHYLYAASPVGGSVSSPSSSVPSSPSPSPSHSSSGKTSATAHNSSRCSSEPICSTAPSHPGEFFTLYNGAPVATAPGGLTAISMVPANCFSFALAPAPPLADHHNSGPLTPTSPDYHLLDAELTRNEVMSNNGRSVFSSPCGYNNLYTHSPCHSPIMYGHHSNPFSSNTSVNNGYNSPNYHHHGNSYSNETNDNPTNKFYNPMNQNQPQNHSNNQNNSYKLSSSTGNGYGSNKTSGGTNGGNNQTGNGTNSNNSGRKNSAISCSLGSPVRNFNGNYRHPSTPKSTCAYTGRPRDRSSSSTTNTGYDVVSSRTFRHLHGQQPHLVAKSVNGVTVMALPPPLMVTSGTNGGGVGPTTMLNVSAKDHQLVQGDFSNHLPPMTPPRTPATPPRRDNGNKVTDPIMAIKKLTL